MTAPDLGGKFSFVDQADILVDPHGQHTALFRSSSATEVVVLGDLRIVDPRIIIKPLRQFFRLNIRGSYFEPKAPTVGIGFGLEAPDDK